MKIISQGDTIIDNFEILYLTNEVAVLRLGTKDKSRIFMLGGDLELSLCPINNCNNPTKVSLSEFSPKDFFATEPTRHGINIVLMVP